MALHGGAALCLHAPCLFNFVPWHCCQSCSHFDLNPLSCSTFAVPSSGAGWTVGSGRPARAAAAAAAASSPISEPTSESERLARLTGYLGDRGVELGLGWSCKVTPK